MKMFFILSLLSFSVLAQPEHNDMGSFYQKKTNERLDINKFGIKYLDISNLLFVANDGFLAGTTELYLTTYSEFGYPKVVDIFEGHSPELRWLDLDKDGNKELLIKYILDAKNMALRIYPSGSKGIDFSKHVSLFSNMSAIEVVDDEKDQILFSVKNQSLEKEKNISESIYFYSDEVLVKRH